ncbi:hypothetical protein ACH9DO_03065 [Kocuria sp. M1N1S27]|uniref:hypothetical protein n=1 Tax=Kocuria kalidii TaxID=3376283 RepID=UPI0037AFAB68
MALNLDNSWWRKSLAIGILPFAALGVVGCDNTEPAEEEVGVEEEAGVGEEEMVEEEEAG